MALSTDVDKQEKASGYHAYEVRNPIRSNFAMQMGEDEGPSLGEGFEFTVKKSITNRIRYWLFCKFFPFRIVRWE